MEKEFEGACLFLTEPLEGGEIELLFPDAYHWLYYSFLMCRDNVCSEKSSVLRTQLYNLAASLFRNYEKLSTDKPWGGSPIKDVLPEILEELVAIAEYSRAFHMCLWVYGDETSKEDLDFEITRLPPPDQIERLMRLPHLQRLERERPSYMHDSDECALKRYRREEADFNRRRNQRKRIQGQSPI